MTMTMNANFTFGVFLVEETRLFALRQIQPIMRVRVVSRSAILQAPLFSIALIFLNKGLLTG